MGEGALDEEDGQLEHDDDDGTENDQGGQKPPDVPVHRHVDHLLSGCGGVTYGGVVYSSGVVCGGGVAYGSVALVFGCWVGMLVSCALW